MARPFLSVLIDTYNHERFIEQAIVSVLEQDIAEADREIIVVDDGSTDRTPDIVRQFEPRLRLVRKKNGGQASAFNVGIPECRGEIIAFLDGDDSWAPNKLRAVSQVFASDPAVGLVGHAIVEVFSNGARRIVAPEKNERLRLDSLTAARVFRLRKSYLGTSRMSLRAELAKRILPVPEALVIEADEYLFTVAAALSEMVILKDALTNYHIHGGNLYVSAGGDTAGLRRKQQVMEALANSLSVALPAKGVFPEVTNCVVEIVQAEADQMRLMLDGGSPWETVRTEKKIYEVLHADAPRNHRVFRQATMLAAGVLPPKWFYRARRWVGSRGWYRGAREKFVPVPGVSHVSAAEKQQD
ncbi:MAG: glycosyltransferase [Candidatus Acidiferrum sp.]|jgi:glycosyl transferase family 2